MKVQGSLEDMGAWRAWGIDGFTAIGKLADSPAGGSRWTAPHVHSAEGISSPADIVFESKESIMLGSSPSAVTAVHGSLRLEEGSQVEIKSDEVSFTVSAQVRGACSLGCSLGCSPASKHPCRASRCLRGAVKVRHVPSLAGAECGRVLPLP